MSRLFEELDYRPTPMGTLILRRRRDLARNVDVYEIKLGDTLAGDPRCRMQHGDFFELCESPAGAFDLPDGRRRADAILVDIDHAPDNLLSPSHASFYTAEGLNALAGHLEPGGIFGLWSNDPPDAAFIRLLGEVFANPEAQVVKFENAAGDGEAACTVYLARKRTE